MNKTQPQIKLNQLVEDRPVPLQPYQPLAGEHPYTATFDGFHNLKIGADWLPMENGKYTSSNGLQHAYYIQYIIRYFNVSHQHDGQYVTYNPANIAKYNFTVSGSTEGLKAAVTNAGWNYRQ